MLWVLKRTVSMSTQNTKHMLKLMGKKLFTIVSSKTLFILTSVACFVCFCRHGKHSHHSHSRHGHCASHTLSPISPLSAKKTHTRSRSDATGKSLTILVEGVVVVLGFGKGICEMG